MPSKKQADDKTSGDANQGRMAPGAEGRGGHRIQRRPNIDGDFSGEMKKLQEQAFNVSEFLGHDPELWRTQVGENHGSIRCRKCQRTAGFALYPMRGREQINGPSVEEKCSK